MQTYQGIITVPILASKQTLHSSSSSSSVAVTTAVVADVFCFFAACPSDTVVAEVVDVVDEEVEAEVDDCVIATGVGAFGID